MRPPELLCPRLNRHLGRRIEPLAGERCPPHPTQAQNRPGSRRSGPDMGNPEMLEFALSQETARRGESSVSVCFCTHLLKERAISFSSGFSGPWDDSVRRPASSLSPTTHFSSSQQSTVWGRYSSPRTSGQSRLGPREFGEDASERTAICTPFRCTTTGMSIVPLEPLAQHLEAWLTLPSLSLAHMHNSTRLRNSVCQATSQVQRRSRDVGGSPECPCLARGDCCPPGKGCNQAGPSSRDEAGDLQPLLHRTQERWWHSANPGSASL